MRKHLDSMLEHALGARHKLATAAILALMCVLGYHAVFGANGLLAYEAKRRESQDLQRQLQSLEQQNAQLQDRIKGLKSDPKAIEKEAREQLRYVRPGEVVYTLPPNSNPKPASSVKGSQLPAR
ncbi:MAG TPA: septum formation initiator family protein [Candidatus Angelobacter sp.]|jgi:cell division protein FtsB|nr:septum formation initiator family protein [Candidatus Angelobacter sp.]